MNYKRHYELLIKKSKNRVLEGYKERHHIVPRCMGGNDDKDNIVELTAREHFLAHLLLVKIYNNNYRLIRAVAMMCVGQEERKTTNRLYGKIRELWKESMSECQSGKGNSQWGTKWIHNPYLKQSIKIPKTDPVPEGWKIGRVIKFDKELKKVGKIRKKDLQKEQNKKIAEDLYKKYIEGNFKSIREFVRLGNYKYSHVSLTLMWKKYVPEFKENVRHGKSFIPE
jgi:hypothetical protein